MQLKTIIYQVFVNTPVTLPFSTLAAAYASRGLRARFARSLRESPPAGVHRGQGRELKPSCCLCSTGQWESRRRAACFIVQQNTVPLENASKRARSLVLVRYDIPHNLLNAGSASHDNARYTISQGLREALPTLREYKKTGSRRLL